MSSTEIVAVGASAGGLHALQVVLSGLPSDFPAPVVVVQHLDPRHRSLMPEILARHAAMPVAPATDGAHLDRGTITIAVPDHHLVVGPGGRVGLDRGDPVRFVRPAIDLLFRSVATTYGAGATVVVLTGTGRDGSAGVGDVHAAGGTVIVQDPETAEFSAMPAAAVATGVADHVLPLDRIAASLVQVVGRTEP